VSPEDIIARARAAIAAESASVAALAQQLDDHFVNTARILLDCKGHVLVAGMGTSHAVAARLAHLLTCSGTPALFIHPGDSQHGLSGAITERDVLICISKGGESTEVNFLAQTARKRGAVVIAFTEKPESTLGKLSHETLRIQSPSSADLMGVIATGSSLTTAAMGDALCAVMLQLRGISKEAFGATHPGGAVGLLFKPDEPK
jgi:arabinose-5-phosphate isomerase